MGGWGGGDGGGGGGGGGGGVVVSCRSAVDRRPLASVRCWDGARRVFTDQADVVGGGGVFGVDFDVGSAGIGGVNVGVYWYWW